MIKLEHSGKRRGADFGRALARLTLATAIAAGAAALAAGDGSILAAANRGLSPGGDSGDLNIIVSE
jgi:hypothetical protein